MAKYEKRTPFCDVISDQMDEIKFALRFEKQNGHERYNMIDSYKSLFRGIKGKRILLKNDHGMGKISIIRHIEWDWAKEKFKHFRLVLLVHLCFLKSDDKLEDIIIRQNIQLRKMAFKKEKLRGILEVYGHDCLLLLDGLGEHSQECSDIQSIIKGTLLPECSIIASCRSDFVTGEMAECFKTVVKCEGFPKDYAKVFCRNHLSHPDKVRDVLNAGIYNEATIMIEKDAPVPLYRNPALFLFVCILVELNEINRFPVKTGEVYFRTVRFLYRKYCLESKVSDDYAKWLNDLGMIAFKMLKEGPLLVNNEDMVKNFGRGINHRAILSENNPMQTVCDEYYLKFPSFAVQEFFAAFYYKKKVRQEKKENTAAHNIFGELMYDPKELFRKYRTLRMSNMFQLFVDYVI